jgi:hypothetical protein
VVDGSVNFTELRDGGRKNELKLILFHRHIVMLVLEVGTNLKKKCVTSIAQ